MAVIPTQERSLDPYSNRRFASVINRMTRIISEGQDCILHPTSSFQFTRKDNSTLTVSSGLCIKDDVLIHITEDFDIDFTDSEFYVEGSVWNFVGDYYIILNYVYVESFPAPKAKIMVVKNASNFDSNSHIFLGKVAVVDDGGYKLSTPLSYSYDDSTVSGFTRVYPPGRALYIDGGEL